MEGMRDEGGCRVCLRCGKLMPAEASFCNSCGSYMKAEPVLGWQGSAEPAFFRGLYAGLPVTGAKQTAAHAAEPAAGRPAAAAAGTSAASFQATPSSAAPQVSHAYPAGYTQPQTDIMSIISLICAIASFVIPLIPAVAAISLGSTSRERIRESGGKLTGENIAMSGIILGTVNIVIVVIAVVVFVTTTL